MFCKRTVGAKASALARVALVGALDVDGVVNSASYSGQHCTPREGWVSGNLLFVCDATTLPPIDTFWLIVPEDTVSTVRNAKSAHVNQDDVAVGHTLVLDGGTLGDNSIGLAVLTCSYEKC